MASLLTGDFQAVLQVSAATFNRLLASMHQNAWREPELPSFPHSTGLRIGDEVLVDGVRGTAFAQISVPRIELIDRATDRFQLEVNLRIRYEPDPDTEPLPTYIHGTLRAIYALEDIDPTCPGWRKLASDYWWIRVVEDSVSFTGSYTEDEWHFAAAAVIDEQAMDAMMTRQLQALLVFGFEPAPHKVDARFRRGSFISMNQGYGEIDELPVLPNLKVPVGGSAVAVPLSLDGGTPQGSLASLSNVLLANRDFAVAVGVETIMGLVEPALAEIRAYTDTYQVTASGPIGSISTVYHASVSSATALWLPQGSFAVIEVKAHGGAHTESVLPDLTFDVTQRFQVDFDASAGAEVVRLQNGGCNASVTSSLPGEVKHNIAQTIANTVSAKADAAVGSAQPYLQQFTSGRSQLVDVLKSMDNDSDAHFDDCAFHLSGVIVRGWISVARRRKPVISIKKINEWALSGFESWIPGGRIDRLEWSWAWATSVWTAGETTDSHRYVLTRPAAPAGSKANRFGVKALTSPLPGLDGSGEVCLKLYGHVVDTNTGQLVATEFGAVCAHFGFFDTVTIDHGRLHLREFENAEPEGVPHPPGPVEHRLLQVTALDGAVSGTNTLIVYADEEWSEVGSTLVDGLDGCTREDAGLLVMVLLPDGVLSNGGGKTRGAMEEFATRLEAPMLVNEDVEGAWSRAFAVPADRKGAPSWRLLSPSGGVLWMQDGSVEGGDLATVLDDHLYPSPPAEPTRVQTDMEVVMLAPETLAWLFAHAHPERPHCPPWELRGVNVTELIGGVTFVRKAERSATELAERLRAEHGARGDDDPDIVIVLDDADRAEADALAAELGPAFTVVPDPDGSLAHRIGVRMWPTTVSLTDASLAAQGADVQ